MDKSPDKKDKKLKKSNPDGNTAFNEKIMKIISYKNIDQN